MAIGANINAMIAANVAEAAAREVVRTERTNFRNARLALIADVQDANDNGVAGINGGNPGFLLDGTNVYTNGLKVLRVTYDQANNVVRNVSLVEEGQDTQVVAL